MFQAKLHRAAELKRIIESIKDVVNNVNIEASPQGLSFQAMDLSHVALVTLRLDADGFNEYKADKIFTLGVKLQNLNKILKCANSDDLVVLECEDEPQQLHIKFESQNGDKISKFTLNLIQNDEDKLSIPETNYSSNLLLPSSEFTRIVRELSQLSETVKVTTSKKSVVFSVDGDIGRGEIELKENGSDNLAQRTEISVDEDMTASFSLTFLNSFCKASVLSDSVRLLMSGNTPLVVEYKITNLGVIRYYLAPKLQDDN